MKLAYTITGIICLYPSIGICDYPSYTVERRGIVHNSNLGTAFPCVTRAPNGDLLAQFNTTNDGAPGGRSYLVRSSDEGMTWGSPVLLAEPIDPYATILTDVGLTTLTSGRVIFSFTYARWKDGWFPGAPYPGHQYAYPFVIYSDDNGITWSPWIQTQGLELGMGSPFGKPIELPDGSILLSLWVRYEWVNVESKVSWGHSGYTRSRDGGLTWGPVIEIGPYGETGILLGKQGQLLAAGKRNGSIQMTRFASSVNGTFWQEHETRPFMGGKNATLHRSPNGFLLSFLNYELRGHIVYSLDEGYRWWEGHAISPILEAGDIGTYGYGISAINLDAERMMLVYFAEDPSEPKPIGAFGPTHAYVGYTIIRETVNLGEPIERALTDAPLSVTRESPITAEIKPYAYPCPWRSDRNGGTNIKFGGLPESGEIKIYTVAAEHVRTVNITNAKADWDLRNDNGSSVASGVYLFLVKGSNGETGRGKMAVIK